MRAIRTYTAENDTYINPAISNYTPGLESHVAPNDDSGAREGPADPNDVRHARLEGAAHASMAMKGLAKLPAYSGTAYRGFRLHLDRFHQLFPGVGGVGTNGILQGTSKGTSVPLGFLSRGSGDVPIEAMMEIRYRGKGAGRDIATLSTMPSELEVLMLPGARYEVVSIEKLTFDATYSAAFVREPYRAKVSAEPRVVNGKKSLATGDPTERPGGMWTRQAVPRPYAVYVHNQGSGDSGSSANRRQATRNTSATVSWASGTSQ